MDDESRTPTAASWLLVVAFLAAAGWAAKSSHPTFEEPVHVTMGLHGAGELVDQVRLPPGISPLEVLLSVPLYLKGARAPDSNKVLVKGPIQARWNDAVERLSSGRQGVFEHVRLARAMALLLAVLAAWLVRHLGQGFGGPILGLVAMGLLLCWPPWFTHAQLANTDVGQALLAVAVLLACREFTESGTTAPAQWVRAGLVLGVALWAGPVGTALLVFLAVVAVAVTVSNAVGSGRGPTPEEEKEATLKDYLHSGRMIRGLRRTPRRTGSVLTRFAVVAVTGLLVVNALGRFEGFGRPLSARPGWPGMESPLAQLPPGVNSLALWASDTVPLPLPDQTTAQWARALEPSADGGDGWFHGQHQERATIWQGPVVLFLKTPLPLALLTLLGLGCVLWRRRWMAAGALTLLVGWPAYWCLLGALGLVPAESRAWLPVLPSLAILAGIGFLMGARVGRGVGGVLCSIPAWVLLAATLYTTVRTFPYQHAFLQEGFGDLEDSRHWFARSDGDWGQDLGRVGAILRERGMGAVAVGHYGAGRVGIPMASDPLPSLGPAAPPGVVIGDGPRLPDPLPDLPLVISTSLLEGAVLPGSYDALRGREPDEMLTPTFALFLPPHPSGWGGKRRGPARARRGTARLQLGGE